MTSRKTPGQNPPIVFVSQMGTGGKAWQPVLDRVASNVPTFTYDRPGTGDRPGRPAPNPPIPYSVFAAELLYELEQADIFEPAVLVGHSVGGLITRTFAGAYPARVAGMVHVDASIPRLRLWENAGPSIDGDGPDATEVDVVVGEVEILESPLPRVPSVVLTRTPGRWDVPIPHPIIDRLWSASQRHLADQAGAPLIVATAAGHQIPAEAPRLVAYAVDAVVRAVQTSKTVHLDPADLEDAGGWVDRIPLGAL